MPDLLTHACSGLLLAWGLAGRRPAPRAPLFVAGNMLPDVLCRVPAIAMGEIDRKIVALPQGLLYGWEPLHQPLGLAFAALAIAQLFPPGERRRTWGLLFLGALMHLFMDALQFHEGAGQLLLFPFSLQPVEIGCMSSEASVLAAGPLLLVVVGLGLWRRRSRPPG